MNLLYLSNANLNERLFIQNLVNNYKWKTPTILLHDTFGGTVRDTLMVSKRLSALFSECMVHNNVFAAAQRDMLAQKEGKLFVAKNKIEGLLGIIPFLILSPILKVEEGETLGNPLEMLLALRETFEVEEVSFFTANAMSPLGNKRKLITNEEERDELLKIYDEESAVISLAHNFRPARICSGRNYSE
jgi:hypothetical protein